MTINTIKALKAGEAALMLRLALGPRYSWEDRIADMRRGKVTSGPILKPIGKLRGSASPLYTLADIKEFVKEYRLYDANARPGVKVQFVMVEVDTAVAAPLWRYRKLSAPTRNAAYAPHAIRRLEAKEDAHARTKIGHS